MGKPTPSYINLQYIIPTRRKAVKQYTPKIVDKFSVNHKIMRFSAAIDIGSGGVVKSFGKRTAAAFPICACDGIGRHARFRFSCFQRVGSSPFRRTKKATEIGRFLSLFVCFWSDQNAKSPVTQAKAVIRTVTRMKYFRQYFCHAPMSRSRRPVNRKKVPTIGDTGQPTVV